MAKEGVGELYSNVEWKACAVEYTTLSAQAIYKKAGKDSNGDGEGLIHLFIEEMNLCINSFVAVNVRATF